MGGGSHLCTPMAAWDLAMFFALYMHETRCKSSILYGGVEARSCVVYAMLDVGDTMGSVLQPSCQAMFIQVKVHHIGVSHFVLLGQGRPWGFSE